MSAASFRNIFSFVFLSLACIGYLLISVSNQMSNIHRSNRMIRSNDDYYDNMGKGSHEFHINADFGLIDRNLRENTGYAQNKHNNFDVLNFSKDTVTNVTRKNTVCDLFSDNYIGDKANINNRFNHALLFNNKTISIACVTNDDDDNFYVNSSFENNFSNFRNQTLHDFLTLVKIVMAN